MIRLHATRTLMIAGAVTIIAVERQIAAERAVLPLGLPVGAPTAAPAPAAAALARTPEARLRHL